MAIARELFEQGKVREAEKALTAYLREHPTDVAQRTFLFELLCFSGEYARAEKQLAALAQSNSESEMGAILYYAALHAERTRHDLFGRDELPKNGTVSPSGVLNGRRFRCLQDADPEIGPRLEVFAAGAYLWIPFEHIASIEMEKPRRLRDTLWTPAFVRTGPSFQGKELGEVLIPAIYPYSWKHPDESVWLGRVTDWMSDEHGNQYPVGQKMLLLDGEEVPFLEMRSLQFTATQVATPAAS
jgi:type VI secretion system protein ImpE